MKVDLAVGWWISRGCTRSAGDQTL